MRQILSAFSIPLLITSTACMNCVVEDVSKLKWLDSADPIADAKKAFASGDRSLRSVYGLTEIIPGIDPKEAERYKLIYAIKPIEGTNDFSPGREFARLNRKAAEYAMLYNRQIIASSVSQPNGPPRAAISSGTCRCPSA